jgi:hypothetical protein
MSTSDHADFEALSAFVDGEAPEWAEHVAGCEVCRAGAAELRALSLAVGSPVDGPAPAVREAALAAAVDALPAPVAAGTRPPSRLAPDRQAAERARFARRGAPRPWAMPAVAAVVVGLLGLGGVVLSSNRGSENLTTVAGGPLESEKAANSLAGAPRGPVSDLGDLPDAATLRARALGAPAPAGAASGTGRSSSSSNSGAGSDAVTDAPTAVSGSSGLSASQSTASGGTSIATGAASGGAGGSAAATVVGTRPCEEQARTREPALGVVVYFATASRGGVKGYVLGFTPNGAPAPVTLLVLAQDGCRELLRSVGP